MCVIVDGLRRRRWEVTAVQYVSWFGKLIQDHKSVLSRQRCIILEVKSVFDHVLGLVFYFAAPIGDEARWTFDEKEQCSAGVGENCLEVLEVAYRFRYDEIHSRFGRFERIFKYWLRKDRINKCGVNRVSGVYKYNCRAAIELGPKVLEVRMA